MNEYAVHVERLGKKYHIAETHSKKETLAEQMGNFVMGPMRRVGKLLRGQQTGAAELDETFWALRDINFDIKHGEIVGIIGKNGAGKSTLLKLLSQITYPTEGRITINGRVGSLLEVGTGFHQELTGRENVYMNGAILGMTKQEVDRKFDEIVMFAGIEQFIDTPIKHYSSGMTVRLAFAVAANLEPDILIIDEVLSVGDADFQRKSIGKMNDVVNEGRTVLFVSHNLPMVRQLCKRGILLEHGQITKDDLVANVINTYIDKSPHGSMNGQITWEDGIADEGIDEISIYGVRVIDDRGQISASLDHSKPYIVEIEYAVHKPLQNTTIGFSLNTDDGITMFHTYDIDTLGFGIIREVGRYVIQCEIPGWFLAPGSYNISIFSSILRVKWLCRLEHILTFKLNEIERYHPLQTQQRPGLLAPKLNWHIQAKNDHISTETGK